MAVNVNWNKEEENGAPIPSWLHRTQLFEVDQNKGEDNTRVIDNELREELETEKLQIAKSEASEAISTKSTSQRKLNKHNSIDPNSDHLDTNKHDSVIDRHRKVLEEFVNLHTEQQQLGRNHPLFRDFPFLADDHVLLDNNVRILLDFESEFNHAHPLYQQLPNLTITGYENINIALNGDMMLDDQFLEVEEPRRPVEPTYPRGERKYTECLICYEWKELHLRMCCGFPACDDCHAQYFTTQVTQGITKIECLNQHCNNFIHRDEILTRLTGETKDKFYRFLVEANKSPSMKTCPRCSHIMSLEKHLLAASKLMMKRGIKVVCPECDLVWCFPCQAPWHEGASCKQYLRGDKLLKNWAREFHYGQQNAQKCPRCKVYIQRTTGCDHMTCSKCKTGFCYRCGERFRELKFIGDHYSKLSIFGCKYRFKPDKPAQRKFIRGSIFGGKLVAAPVAGTLAIGAGAVLLVAGILVLPFYGSYRLHKKIQQKKRIKRQRKAREEMRKRLEAIRARGEELEISCPMSFSDNLEELEISRLDRSSPKLDFENHLNMRQDCLSYDPFRSMTLRLNIEDDISSTSSESEDECEVKITEVKVITERIKQNGILVNGTSGEDGDRSADDTINSKEFLEKSSNDTASLDRIVEDMIKMASDIDSIEHQVPADNEASDIPYIDENLENQVQTPKGEIYINQCSESTKL